MNDLMSGGLHRLWKRFALLQTAPAARATRARCRLRHPANLGAGLARQVGGTVLAVLTDINGEMLARGRDRLIDEAIEARFAFVIANAEWVPFADASFDCVTMRVRAAQRHGQARGARLDASRAARAGGCWCWSSRSRGPHASSLRRFSLPGAAGGIVAGDASELSFTDQMDPAVHLSQERSAAMTRDAGFDDCHWHNLAAGMVAVALGIL